MTDKQRLELRLSQVRQRLNELAGLDGDDFGDDQKAEASKLEAEYGDLEVRWRAAAIATQEDTLHEKSDAEGVELRGLLSKASLARMIGAIANDTTVDGAEAEVRQALGIGGSSIPVQLLLDDPDPEVRAVATATGTFQTSQRPVRPQLFPTSIAAFLGIARPTVPPGTPAYTSLTTGATVEQVAAGSGVTESTAAFTSTTVTPSKLMASFSWSSETAATVPGLEAALRTNLSAAIAAQLDNRVLLADGNRGLIAGGLGTLPTASSTDATWGSYKASVVEQVDGRYAGSPDQVRVVWGASTFAHASSVYRGTATDDDAAETVRRISGGLRVSADVPAVTSDAQYGLSVRTRQQSAVLPVWSSVRIIRDEITEAAKAEVKLTALVLYSFLVLDAQAFALVSHKVQ